MILGELRRRLGDPADIRQNAFELLRELCRFHSGAATEVIVQELILRALEHRDHFGQAVSILDGLVRDVGLFPYLSADELGLADRLAFEAHRPPDLDKIVFHHPQARVFYALMAGKSVVLSAPTSFGKSLIIDAIVASMKFRSIVIVVPTLALIDETRRRLSTFREHYSIITQPFQKPGPRSIYIMTQERVLGNPHLETVDFFVIDEFYKLSPTGERDQHRCASLNQAFYELAKRCKHFYLLGPGIEGISDEFQSALHFEFFHEPYHTVVSELHYIKAGSEPLDTLGTLARRLTDQTLIFCSSPERTKSVAGALPDANTNTDKERTLKEAVAWISKNYHPQWHFIQALERGIGIHHGRVPRALAQFVVRAFNDGLIRFLVCTSTLIEGVNTKAKNIVVFDHKINKRTMDLFTFNNIRGRSGRMFQHFVGHVYVFHNPPQEGLPVVDVPAFSQGATAPDELLVQLDEDDLTEESEERVAPFKNHPEISFDTIRANVGVEPGAQIALANELASNPRKYSQLMSWRGLPSWDGLLQVCQLIWTFFGGAALGSSSAKSPQQLAAMLNLLVKKPTIADLILGQLKYAKDADDAIKTVLDFLRLWANFHFPKLIRAIGNIQREVLEKRGLPYGDYEAYAMRVEHLFLDPSILALEEYGIPLPLARKLEPVLRPNGDLDALLKRLRTLNLDGLPLSSFERATLADAIEFL